MVSTRGTDQNVVAFVSGKEKVDSSNILPDDWVAIIRSAINELPINYLRGLKPVSQILLEHQAGILRELKEPVPRLWLGSQAREGNELRPNEVLLDCARYGYDFPANSQTAPRILKDRHYAPIHTRNFLLDRRKKLYCLSMSWHAKAEELFPGSSVDKLVYQADSLSMRLGEMDDHRLSDFFRSGNFERLGEQMLNSFYQALSMSAGDVRGQFEHLLEKKQTVGGYLDRIGELAH